MIFHSQPTIEKDDIEEVRKLLESGMIAEGKKVEELENKLCNYIGTLKAKATCTGRSALVLGLWTLGIKEGDEVILPTYVCHSVMDGVTFVGAKPVIVDIGDDYCIDPEEVRKHITAKTRAVIVAHIFGISARVRELKEILEGRSICLIEDCAQSVGGESEERKLGSFGDISFFSFQATKVITTGEGGALLLNNSELVENFARVTKVRSEFLRMSDSQAILGINQLGKLDEFIKKRKKIAEKYIELLNNFMLIDIPVKNMEKSIFFRFPIRVKRDYSFDLLRERMENYGIHIRKGVDRMLHSVLGNVNDYSKADLIFRETVSLPIYPSMNLSDVVRVVDKLKKSLSG